MNLPDPEGRPVWEPVVIALFLALVVGWDAHDVLALLQGRMPAGGQARAALELGVAAMLLWGLVRSLIKAAAWKAGADDAA
jgi:hypothetical protein